MKTTTTTTMLVLVLSQLFVTVTAQSLCQTIFNYEYFIQNIPENTPVGSNIGHVQITGTDSEISLIQRPNDYFLFDGSSRNITLVRELDTDQNATEIPVLLLNCTILGQNADPYKITVRVIVDDWNDNAPQFTSYHHNTSISEAAEIGTTVYTGAIATDNDKRFTRNAQISYRIVEDTTYSDYFEIPTLANSIVTLRRQLDFESIPQMIIYIEARDNPFPSSGEPRSSTATLTVNILDADDQSPIFSSTTSMYRGSIAQDAPQGTIVDITPTIYAVDPDTMDVPISYRLWDVYDVFQIDNVTATISTKAPFTVDMQVLNVVVFATQVDNRDREQIALLTITIEAANINAPRFSKTLYQVTKLELEPIGSILETTTATDIDFGTQIEYSIVESIDDIVINNEGSLILQKSLDYEIRQEWLLHVTASDGSNTATATVIITVADVNDNNPIFDPVPAIIEINRDQGRLVTVVTATDGDFDDILTYSIQNYQSLFTINDAGELYVTGSESLLVKEEYTVLVTVSDNRLPPRTNTTAITVKFPPLGSTLPPPTGSTVKTVPPSVLQEDNNMITIILGVLAGVLLIVIVILVIVLIIRQKRMKEALNRAREPKGYAAKGLTYRQADSPDDLPKMDLHYADDTDGTSEYDGATTIQENPLTDQGVNEGYLQSSVSDEMDREMNEIEIETAVVPYDDDFGYPSGRNKYSTHLRTFQGDDTTSSGSAQSDSTGGSRRVLVNGDKNNTGSKLTSWDSDDKIHPQGAEKLLDQGLPNTKQNGEKPEITVYF